MPPNRIQRSSGACLQCSRKKRKCLKRNVVCQPQTFKAWSVPASRGQPSRFVPSTPTNETERAGNKSGPERSSVIPESPPEPPVATPDLAIELPIHNRQITLDRPIPDTPLEGDIFDDPAWLNELLDTSNSPDQTSPDQTEGSVISRPLREPSIAATNLATELPMHGGQITLDPTSPSNTLGGDNFNDSSWLNELPQVPLTPCSEVLQVIQHGHRDATTDYLNNNTYGVDAIAQLDAPGFYDTNTPSLSVGTFDRAMKFLPIMRETAREASLAVVPQRMGSESNDERLLAKITVDLGQPTYNMLEMDEEEISQNFCADFQNWTSHPVLAFSPRLINPLLRLGQLLELQHSNWTLTGQNDLSDLDLEVQVEQLEGALLSARNSDLVTSQSRSADPIELGSLNDAMHSAAAILLYARLKGMPSTATLIRHHVGIVTGKISNIDHNSRTSYAIVFPLFTAGCEAVDLAVRSAIVRRIRALKGLFYNRGDLVGALRHIWEIRDREPGLAWLEWLAKVDSGFGACFRMPKERGKTSCTQR
ncbi:hypothetical protein G7Z17_g1686 [Cylindrodendrum hubeiense]|uniref:Zn(2)-C6 fungal-type domain-containing protein n=1 Tax=Cylindrodendrum hubeiense TaxID=595255 RepID=A0A9P5HL09_9HYPO|nr:hypothetical protein G7Z17_g1686 [Cylindrodendrum hubeiense]